jgi:ferric-dicitrate binding protein FerR (iron transport regulator)
MTTPRGGQYQLTMPDGTQVWLNAASSITYPTVFTGKTRNVSITGEAYFEVRHNASKPFIVETPADRVEVLGTRFNVNAYADEPGVKISLLAGSVRVAGHVLRPGEAYSKGHVTATNVQQDVAWKNGAFSFSRSDLRAAMRQLARWYDIDIRYANDPSEKFISGNIGRDLRLSEVMSGLEGLGIRSRLDGRTLTLTVTP